MSFWFILGVIALVISLICLANGEKAAAAVVALVAVLLVCASCVTFVSTGNTGILATFGKVEDDRTMEAGLNFKAPWQTVIQMDNRVQEKTIDLSCFSSDIQEVNVSIAVGYRINQANAMTIYKEIGKNYYDVAVAPHVQEVVKAAIAHYTASSLIESRNEASALIDANLRETLSAYNVELNYASIVNIDFTDTFTDSVEAKVKAQQEKERAATEAERKKVEAQAAADAAVIEAEAAAERQKIEADAELYVANQKAEANSVLNESLTDNLLEYYKIMNVEALWNGELPQYVGGESDIPVLNMG